MDQSRCWENTKKEREALQTNHLSGARGWSFKERSLKMDLTLLNLMLAQTTTAGTRPNTHLDCVTVGADPRGRLNLQPQCIWWFIIIIIELLTECWFLGCHCKFSPRSFVSKFFFFLIYIYLKGFTAKTPIVLSGPHFPAKLSLVGVATAENNISAFIFFLLHSHK